MINRVQRLLSDEAQTVLDPQTTVRIFWRIGAAEGHGSPVSYRIALGWINALNRKYGADTHWAEPVHRESAL